MEIFCNITNVFTFTFDQMNASLLKKSINFLQKKHTDPKLLNDSVYRIQRSVVRTAQRWNSLVKEDVDLHMSPEVKHRWEGGKENTKESSTMRKHTHTLWYSRFPSVSFLVVIFCVDSVKPCVISLACQSQASKSNKPVSATGPAGPATVAVWPMTSSPRHSGRVIQEKGLETVCQRGKVSENVRSR